MIIKVGRNQTECLIDEEDYKVLNKKGNFFCNTDRGYIIIKNYLGTVDGKLKYKEQYLHRLIMNAPKDLQVDHINGNKKDNRRDNLRLCTPSQNSRNKSCVKGNYRGVHFAKKNKKWVAQITNNYKCYHLGMFNTENEAAIEYNKWAKKYFGEFARLNLVNQ